MEIIIAGTVLLAAIAWFVIKKRSARPADPPTRPHQRLATPPATMGETPPATESPESMEPPAVPDEVREALGWAPQTAADTAASPLLDKLRQLPRPPDTLRQLTSPGFLQKATSVELSELVLGEPQVAAKVLATVNSPLYGLSRPVTNIGQGITFLGLNTVRAICLQHMLRSSFPASPELSPVVERLWTSSAVSSELSAVLSAKLGLREGGVMVTQAVLSHLGPMAMLSLLPLTDAQAWAEQPLLERCRMERRQLGLTAAEVGHLILKEWGLPSAVIDCVERFDRMLHTPATELNSTTAATALSYWCVRIGERLVRGNMPAWDAYDWRQDDSPELVLAKHYLEVAWGERLTEALADPQIPHKLNALLGRAEPDRDLPADWSR